MRRPKVSLKHHTQRWSVQHTSSTSLHPHLDKLSPYTTRTTGHPPASQLAGQPRAIGGLRHPHAAARRGIPPEARRGFWPHERAAGTTPAREAAHAVPALAAAAPRVPALRGFRVYGGPGSVQSQGDAPVGPQGVAPLPAGLAPLQRLHPALGAAIRRCRDQHAPAVGHLHSIQPLQVRAFQRHGTMCLQCPSRRWLPSSNGYLIRPVLASPDHGTPQCH